LSTIIADTVEEARALCTEKFSVTPDVTIINNNIDDPVILAIPSSVHHVVMELLKNSFRATIQRFGEANVHEAAPVRITLYSHTPQAGIGIAKSAAANAAAAASSTPAPAAPVNSREESVIDSESTNKATTNNNDNNTNGNGNGSNDNDDLWTSLRLQGSDHAGISITDEGTGLSQIERYRCWQYMYTTAPPQSEESGYGYSRRFGAPFTGHGVGLPTARQFTRSHGGDLVLTSAGTALGATAAATFERRGITPCVL
jgi:signal transduction histidine kinase